MKHRSFRLVLAASILFCALWTSALCADWSQYRGPQVDGISLESIQCVFPADGPECLWRVPAPAGFSSFAVQGGKAFTLVTRTLDGTASEVCLALDTRMQFAARVPPVFPGRKHEQRAAARNGDSREPPFRQILGRVGQIPSQQRGGQRTLVVNLDPIAELAIFIARAGSVRGHEFADHKGLRPCILERCGQEYEG